MWGHYWSVTDFCFIRSGFEVGRIQPNLGTPNSVIYSCMKKQWRETAIKSCHAGATCFIIIYAQRLRHKLYVTMAMTCNASKIRYVIRSEITCEKKKVKHLLLC